MHILGHVSVAQLAAWKPTDDFDSSWSLAVILGALVPDILDKSLMIAGVFPWGRTIGHSLLVWALLGLMSAMASHRGRARWLAGLVLGGATHLGADFADDLVGGLHYSGYLSTTWFTWPYLNPDLYPVIVQPAWVSKPCLGLYTIIEAFVVVLLVDRVRRTRTTV